MASTTLARWLAEAFAAAGVERAFTVPGESFLPLLDALVAVGIRVIATRHEGGAAFMAEATGTLTGRPGLCIGTRAVGASNLAIGIHTAHQDSTPMIVVLGQVARAFRGREAFQEADLVHAIGGLAKWAVELDMAATARSMVRQGLRTMVSGRPGPVVFAVPEDAFDDEVERGDPGERGGPGMAPEVEMQVEPGLDAVRSVLELLVRAERPLIIAGGGVTRAGACVELIRLAELLGVPVVSAFRRPDVFPNDHPLYLGVTGYGAPGTVRPRVAATDALLVVGSRLSEITTFGYAVPGERTRWAHVDLRPRVSGFGLGAPDLAISADAGAFLRAAVVVATEMPDVDAARRKRGEAVARDRAAYVEARIVDRRPWSGPGVHPGRVVTAVQRVLPGEAILTTDAGNFGLWFARGYAFSRPGSFLGPTSGAMGYGLPAAIAASLAWPGRPVVALAGDGGFAMTMNELETAVREGATPVVLVFDNGRFGTIRMHQQHAGTGAVATDLGAIDYAAVARASGALGVTVDSDDAFEHAFREALASGRPTVLHLHVDPAWVSPDDTP